VINIANISTISGFIKNNMGILGAGVGGLAAGGLVGYAAGRASSPTKKRKGTKAAARKKVSYKRRKSGQRKPYTAGKRKDTSHKRIRFTKNNQPYIILKSGKARFIKKSSARNSRKRKGGRY